MSVDTNSILYKAGQRVKESIALQTTRIENLEQEVTNLGGTVPPPVTGFTIQPVTWTNLSEINLSGEKIRNASFDPPPLAVGSSVQVVTQWTMGGKTASPGEIYVVDLVQASGSIRLTGNGQNIFAATSQQENNITVLHPFSYETTTLDHLSLTPNSGENYIFPELERPYVRGLAGAGAGFEEGKIYRMHEVNTVQNNLRGRIYTLDGTDLGFTNAGTKWEVVELISNPYLWTHASGVLDQDKLNSGIVKGLGGSASVKQMFEDSIPVGTKIVVKAGRTDTNEGAIAFKHLKLDGSIQGGNIEIPRDTGLVEYVVANTDMHGILFTTLHGTREISDVSVFKGTISGGSVQANGNGGLEKISGGSAFNAGASSVNFIPGNADGYVQFQYAQQSKRLAFGLTYLDVDFDRPEPFQMMITSTGSIALNDGGNGDLGDGSAATGDYFRIRHYSADNTVRFQKRQEVFDSNGASLGQDYVTWHTHSTTSSGNNLYVDTSFFHVGGRVNDTLIARK